MTERRFDQLGKDYFVKTMYFFLFKDRKNIRRFKGLQKWFYLADCHASLDCWLRNCEAYLSLLREVFS